MKDINAFLQKERYTFADLCRIMEILRSEHGCPWDREQNHKSIRNNFIEETYEVVEAIDNEDTVLLREELGDVLLQVVFHAQIKAEESEFNIDDVTAGICKKLIMRHPHVFASTKAQTSKEVLHNWEEIKKEEKKRKTTADSMRSVPPMLPALMRAQKVGASAAKIGFDFPTANDAAAKIYEEADETKEALLHGDIERLTEEIGDLLFAVTNTARISGVDSERALNLATEKFINRFEKTERKASEIGADFSKMTLEEMDILWEKVKSDEK